MRLKQLHLGRYELCMLALVMISSLLRVLFISQHWPITNSDEGTIDLMALHIAFKGEHPIFYYGQDYMGSVEAYIGALCFHLFGVSVFSLRLGMILFFALFLICMYYLTSLLYSQGLALFIVGLFSFGSSEVILRQIKAIGGYPEITMLAAVICLLTVRIALSSEQQARDKSRKRLVLYGLLGACSGFALWDDQLILPFLATAGLLLVLFCFHELRRSAGLCLFIGGLIGALPLLIHDLTVPFERNSVAVLFGLQQASYGELVARHFSFLRQLTGTVFITLPRATGANPLCPAETVPLFGTTPQPSATCLLIHAGWSLGYLSLFFLAGLLTCKRISSLWRYRTMPAGKEREALILHSSRLMLLLGASLTLLLYMRSSASALYPEPTARYLVCMFIATPVVIGPLWQGIRGGEGILRHRQKFFQFLSASLLLVIAITFLLGTIRIVNELPQAQAAYQQQQTLIQELQHRGITRFYTDYWTCNRLIFESQEQLICSNLDESLQPGQDRYPAYRELVYASVQPGYVFPHNSLQVQRFQQQARALDISYQRYEKAGYVIFLPQRPLPVKTQD